MVHARMTGYPTRDRAVLRFAFYVVPLVAGVAGVVAGRSLELAPETSTLLVLVLLSPIGIAWSVSLARPPRPHQRESDADDARDDESESRPSIDRRTAKYRLIGPEGVVVAASAVTAPTRISELLSLPLARPRRRTVLVLSTACLILVQGIVWRSISARVSSTSAAVAAQEQRSQRLTLAVDAAPRVTVGSPRVRLEAFRASRTSTNSLKLKLLVRSRQTRNRVDLFLTEAKSGRSFPRMSGMAIHGQLDTVLLNVSSARLDLVAFVYPSSRRTGQPLVLTKSISSS
jgi:hypothetical protein